MSVYSLFDSALQYRHHERELCYLPSGVKTRVSTAIKFAALLSHTLSGEDTSLRSRAGNFQH